MTNAQIILPRGDSRQVAVTIWQPGRKQVEDLTTAVLTMVVKKSTGDASPLFTKSSLNAGEIDVPTPTNGKAYLKLVAGDTLNLTPGLYAWSLRGVWQSGKAVTLLAGAFVVVDHV